MKTVLIFCGGRSAEHTISLRSAKTVLKALDPTLYKAQVVGISYQGLWVYFPDHQHFLSLTTIDEPRDEQTLCGVFQGLNGFNLCIREGLTPKKIPIDVAFPLLHGPYGEDGAIQGLCEMMGLPYVGAGVLASAIGMDKVIFKLLMRQQGLPVVPFLWASNLHACPSFEQALSDLKASALFIKPAVMGSSVGISKVRTALQYAAALEQAFLYGSKVIIEKAMEGREIECALLGNEPFEVSDVCEIIPKHEFYSYEAKYLDPQGATFVMPANLKPELYEQVQSLSKKVASVIGCSGMARVDFFVVEDQVYVNEINTIPGFTSISMYPQLWKHQGVSLPQLCHRLIDAAFAEHHRKQACELAPQVIPKKVS